VGRVEAVEFAVGDDVDAGKLLGLQDDENRVPERGARGVIAKPAGNGIAADDGRPDGHIL
jgi:hypothetical protein